MSHDINHYNASEFSFKKTIYDQNKTIQNLKEEILSLNQTICSLDEKILKNKLEIDSMVNSKSWKLTKPLRDFTFRFSKKNEVFKEQAKEEKTELITDDMNYKNFPSYVSEYEDDIDFSHYTTDIKALAFYLPQYHTFKENDEWWGKGFTEWTNTSKAKPRFEGHYQPRIPHNDIGYYKLDNIETIKKQINLAKKHGIFGFCFYYYWFSGKRLMEKPVDLLLEHKEIDFPFCLCWANENWTRTWDGLEKNVLIEQKYYEDDYINFIKDIKKYIKDERYIRINNKPVILIYNPDAINDFEKMTEDFRETAKKEGIGEILIWSKNNISDDEFKNIDYVDGQFDFAPNGFGHPATKITGTGVDKAFNYQKLVDDIKHLYTEHFPLKPFYYSCTMGWDNSARRKEDYKIYYSYSLNHFYKWLKYIIDETRRRHDPEKRFIFINAWNEWAEGTYLEPDEKYGYANINTLSRALFDLPFDKKVDIIDENLKNSLTISGKLAIQIHLYYTDLIEEIISQLQNVIYSFDCYISTDSKSKAKIIEKRFKEAFKNNNIYVSVFENKGRDVRPFIEQMKNIISNYEYICHIHSKKSANTSYGENWRKYLYNNLFGSKKNVSRIFYMFENNKNLGLIYPSTYHEISDMIEIGNNKNNFDYLCSKLMIKKEVLEEKIVFPSGTMFYARTKAIKDLFELDLNFDDENNQIDGTISHAIERIFVFLVKSRGYDYKVIFNKTND